MTQPFNHLRPSTLMPAGLTCSWYQRTGITEGSTGDDSPVYADPVSIACMPAPLSKRWFSRFPDADLTSSLELWFASEEAASISANDKITFDNIDYMVLDKDSFHGAGYAVACQRIEGIQP